jgi:alpha-tubulin suppressor-like RCC1 family protein
MQGSCSVVSCGWNGFGQLGVGSVEFQDGVCVVRGLDGVDVDQVACGGHHFAGFSVVRASDGRVFVWGDNSFGQLGLEFLKKPVFVPHLLNLKEKAVWVACGSQHMVIVLESGRIVAQGDNSFGQINLPSFGDQAVAAACGDAHTLVLTRSGKVVGFGSDDLGQIGACSAIRGEAVQIACGQSHSLVLLRDGSVLAFGCNAHAQLGIPGVDCVVREPKVVCSNARSVSAGNVHSLVLQNDGVVLGFGSNEHNQLGMRDILMCSGPVSIPSERKFVAAIAGGLHSLLIGEDGTVVTLGCQSEGQGNFTGKAKFASASETHNLFVLL